MRILPLLLSGALLISPLTEAKAQDNKSVESLSSIRDYASLVDFTSDVLAGKAAGSFDPFSESTQLFREDFFRTARDRAPLLQQKRFAQDVLYELTQKGCSRAHLDPDKLKTLVYPIEKNFTLATLEQLAERNIAEIKTSIRSINQEYKEEYNDEVLHCYLAIAGCKAQRTHEAWSAEITAEIENMLDALTDESTGVYSPFPMIQSLFRLCAKNSVQQFVDRRLNLIELTKQTSMPQAHKAVADLYASIPYVDELILTAPDGNYRIEELFWGSFKDGLGVLANLSEPEFTEGLDLLHQYLWLYTSKKCKEKP